MRLGFSNHSPAAAGVVLLERTEVWSLNSKHFHCTQAASCSHLVNHVGRIVWLWFINHVSTGDTIASHLAGGGEGDGVHYAFGFFAIIFLHFGHVTFSGHIIHVSTCMLMGRGGEKHSAVT